MASDDMSREPRAPGDPEEVRIITADEIADNSELGACVLIFNASDPSGAAGITAAAPPRA
jgi:hypothetical protein